MSSFNFYFSFFARAPRYTQVYCTRYTCSGGKKKKIKRSTTGTRESAIVSVASLLLRFLASGRVNCCRCTLTAPQRVLASAPRHISRAPKSTRKWKTLRTDVDFFIFPSAHNDSRAALRVYRCFLLILCGQLRSLIGRKVSKLGQFRSASSRLLRSRASAEVRRRSLKIDRPVARLGRKPRPLKPFCRLQTVPGNSTFCCRFSFSPRF